MVLAADEALVRAASQDEAQEVAANLRSLRPALLASLPGARLDGDLEVWMQDEPHLYAKILESSADAEGLYSPDHQRILLSRNARDPKRVLAHELTHAALDASWAPLRGTLEEGLCDVNAARLVPEEAPGLRAGRLSSAALACGGLRLGLEVRDRRPRRGAKLGWTVNILLTSEEATPKEPLDVFRIRAGLSSTHLEAGVKRGYYGLAFLVADAIGIEGLHELCIRAEAEGLDHIPVPWFLEAAGLDAEPSTWRRAAAQAMGPEELAELVRLYPSALATALAQWMRGLPGSPAERWEAIEGEIRIGEGTAHIALDAVPGLRDEVLSRL